MINNRLKKLRIYFAGICGTGMASSAGIAKSLGHLVVGSDLNVYPPMSNLLAGLNIHVYEGYNPQNIKDFNPDLVVIANSLSRGNPELEYVIENNINYVSFPQLLSDLVLKDRFSVVVTGTHGKTTTTSLLAHLLIELEEKPSYFIGGIPKNTGKSFEINEGRIFVIEGDEYDTAFFDKEPKFMHYCPSLLIINNIEFDHADIFRDVEHIKEKFVQVLGLVPFNDQIIANGDDENVMAVLKQAAVSDVARVVSVAKAGSEPKKKSVEYAGLEIIKNTEFPLWQISFNTLRWGHLAIQSKLTGLHNIYNILVALTAIDVLIEKNMLKNYPGKNELIKAFESFQGVKRRMDHLATVNGIEVFEDFAHHPSAVASVIKGMRTNNPDRRLLVAFEPKNATSRRNLFTESYSKAFSQADRTYIGVCPKDHRIPVNQQMDTKDLAERIGASARAFETNEDLKKAMWEDARPGDTIIFMSSGSFSGVQYDLGNELKSKREDLI